MKITGVRHNADEQHQIIYYDTVDGWQLACIGERCVMFKNGYPNVIEYCPICGNELGEWKGLER